jgi:hypothetical protein
MNYIWGIIANENINVVKGHGFKNNNKHIGKKIQIFIQMIKCHLIINFVSLSCYVVQQKIIQDLFEKWMLSIFNHL